MSIKLVVRHLISKAPELKGGSMSLKSCPICGRKQLKTSSFFSQPFKANAQCDFCDSDFLVRKGWMHYILALIIWLGVLIGYIEINTWEAEVFVKTLSSSFFTILALFITSRLGALRSRRYSRKQFPEIRSSFERSPS